MFSASDPDDEGGGDFCSVDAADCTRRFSRLFALKTSNLAII
jgi:hypothetical protein